MCHNRTEHITTIKTKPPVSINKTLELSFLAIGKSTTPWQSKKTN